MWSTPTRARYDEYPTATLFFARIDWRQRLGPASNLVAMAPGALLNVGGSQAHLNMQPFLTLNFCIALQGIFPSLRTSDRGV